MVYKLATGQFTEVPYQTGRPQYERNPSIHNSNPPPLEDIPKASVREGTSWPNTGSASKNLFEARKDWPFPPIPVPTLTVKTVALPQVAAIPCAMVMPKQVAGKCSWGLHCPICKIEEEQEEDWDGNMQKEQPRSQYPQNMQHPQPQNKQHPQSFDVT